MGILKVVRPLKLNGEVLQSGEMFKAQDGQLLIDRGYARELTQEERGMILDGYIEQAREIFNEPQEPCYCCGKVDYWQSVHGKWTCRNCHPPASPSFVKRRLLEKVR